MKFCPKCNSLLLPQNDFLVCKRCGYKEKGKQKIFISFSSKKKKIKEIVIDEGEPRNLPTADVICPKCNGEKAYYWLVQTRRADEPPTTFYRCIKCNYTWRDYK